MNDKININILNSMMYVKVAEMVIGVSSLVDGFASGICEVAAGLLPGEESSNTETFNKEISDFFDTSEETLTDVMAQMEPMMDSVFVPYVNDIDILQTQGAFGKAQVFIDEIASMYPKLTPFNQQLTAKDLAIYSSLLSSDIENNSVKSLMALFNDLFMKIDKDMNG